MGRSKATDLEAAVIEAYLHGGQKVTTIAERFKLSRTTLYGILRRNGVTPQRTRRQLEAGTRDEILAGLHELIAHQDRLLTEQEAEIRRLRRQLAGATRTAARKQA